VKMLGRDPITRPARFRVFSVFAKARVKAGKCCKTGEICSIKKKDMIDHVLLKCNFPTSSQMKATTANCILLTTLAVGVTHSHDGGNSGPEGRAFSNFRVTFLLLYHLKHGR